MMQILFELEAQDRFDTDTIKELCAEHIKGKERERSENILTYTAANIEEIDKLINDHSKSWKTTRMPKVDLAILRLAIGEEKATDDVTCAVLVSEALNMSKKYSTDQSASFIHGLLGAIFK